MVGHQGPGCKELTSAIEKALGNQTADTETEEYFIQDQDQQQELLEGQG